MKQQPSSRFSADIDTEKLAEAALAILSLTLHDGGRVWKGLDWALMDLLEEKGWPADKPHADLPKAFRETVTWLDGHLKHRPTSSTK